MTGQEAEQLAEWVRENITDGKYAEDRDRYLPLHHDETCGIAWAREKMLRHLKGGGDEGEKTEQAEVHES